MATPEENANKLLKELVRRGCKADDHIQNAGLQQIATEIGIDGADQDAALELAFKQGWFADGPRPATTQVTQGGWDNGNA